MNTFKHVARLACFFSLIYLALAGSKCDNGVLFKEIAPNNLAAPLSVTVDPAKQRAYVINSNNTLEFTTTQFTILNLADPAAPVILDNPANPAPMPNFSSQSTYDAASGFVYTPNRASDSVTDTSDNLLRINVDEASSTFGQIDTFTGGENPFGISCCDALGRLYMINAGGKGPGTIDVYDPADLSSFVQLSLEVRLSSGEDFKGINSTEGVFLGRQLFVTNRNGRIYIINTDEIGDAAKNPIDYILLKGNDLRGIATDGTSLFVVDGKTNATALLVLNPAVVPPVSPDAGTIAELQISQVQTTSIAVGKDPNEVLVSNGRAYVTNRQDNTISVIDIASSSLVTTIPVGDEPFGMAAFTSGGTDYLYVTNLFSDSISIIDTATATVVGTFKP